MELTKKKPNGYLVAAILTLLLTVFEFAKYFTSPQLVAGGVPLAKRPIVGNWGGARLPWVLLFTLVCIGIAVILFRKKKGFGLAVGVCLLFILEVYATKAVTFGLVSNNAWMSRAFARIGHQHKDICHTFQNLISVFSLLGYAFLAVVCGLGATKQERLARKLWLIPILCFITSSLLYEWLFFKVGEDIDSKCMAIAGVFLVYSVYKFIWAFFVGKCIAFPNGFGINRRRKNTMEKAIYDLEGARGRHLEVYEDKVVITTKISFGAFIAGNISDGEKTIYYVDCIGVQFKRSGMQLGYLQLETASGIMNNRQNNFFNENSFTFDGSKLSNEKMEEVADYVRKRVDEAKRQKNAPVAVPVSNADELKKYKELLDMGVITQEEFDQKKKQLLGL